MFKQLAYALGLSMLLGAGAQAEGSFPNHEITLYVPASAGGGADLITRSVAPKLSELLGQGVIVENKPGASGTIAGNAVAKAKPDGYTLVMAQSTSIVSAPHLYKDLPYGPLKDLTPVSLVALVPNILVVKPQSEIKSVKDLARIAAERPGKLTYGSSGLGAPTHLAGRMFETMAKVKMLHVPYKGAGPAVTALLGGEVSMMFAPLNAVRPLIAGKELVPLGVTTGTRLADFPDVPAIAEEGLPGFDINSWFGVFAPAGTPPEVIARLQAGIATALKDPAVSQRMTAQGAIVVGNTTAEFQKFVQTEDAKYTELIGGLDTSPKKGGK